MKLNESSTPPMYLSSGAIPVNFCPLAPADFSFQPLHLLLDLSPFPFFAHLTSPSPPRSLFKLDEVSDTLKGQHFVWMLYVLCL